ncbi:nucleotidyltransferase [Geobacillus sp. WSUCF-018B]|uniref:nucleotidyltransferase domain-containing protein n=1 Tax=Geobacillus sp. WSUCF-018B TaxID=2055939 RepID=UPI000C287F0A|nr:nucleotidyltransferase [Geobacillus sp. WSUCF-018B]PJW18891.1 nucleotidyltransferase [Geobacillus sp. WSUCF-018B]
MANLQKYFEDFHKKIKLEYEDNDTLREKRDILIDKLKKNMPEDAPSFSTFNQGSYAMFTGIKPLEGGQYDIDVGLWFNMSKEDYPDPLVPKQWVYDALKDHTHDVRIKHPCVTVTYKEDGEPAYHVDLTVYAADNPDKKVYLARGKKYSSEENKYWEESNPKELIDRIQNHLDDENDRAQFRRAIRYLKRWKDIKFNNVDKKPSGIGLTVAALDYFSPKYVYDAFTNTRYPDDLQAVTDFVQALINAFKWVYSEEEEKWVLRLIVNLPVPPYTDLFEKMTNKQMETFKEKLEKLLTALQEAKSEVDPVEACKTLQKQFGDDFPVPEIEETGERKDRPAIITESSSA